MSFSPSHRISLEIHQHDAVLRPDMDQNFNENNSFAFLHEATSFHFLGPDKAGANPENIVHMIVPPGPIGYIHKSSLFPFDTKLCDEIKPDFLSFSFGLFPERCLGPSHK